MSSSINLAVLSHRVSKLEKISLCVSLFGNEYIPKQKRQRVKSTNKTTKEQEKSETAFWKFALHWRRSFIVTSKQLSALLWFYLCFLLVGFFSVTLLTERCLLTILQRIQRQHKPCIVYLVQTVLVQPYANLPRERKYRMLV